MSTELTRRDQSLKYVPKYSELSLRVDPGGRGHLVFAHGTDTTGPVLW
jgi:hypothetical protein